MFNTPILFLVFNRPDTTERVFKKIREIKPSFLYIAADGSRIDKQGEKEICEKVRNIVLSNIDWDCEVNTLFRDANLGCGKAVSQAITWFFENVEEGIILEDDCLPDLSFFKFCDVMLDRYRDNEKIMHVGANNFQSGVKRGDGDYYYSILGHIWGWATWRRAWKFYELDLEKVNPISEDSFYSAFRKNEIYIEYYKDNFSKVATKQIDTWDYQWLYTIISKNGLAICPNVNLVENIGFGPNATHTNQEPEWKSLNNVSSIFSYQQPRSIEIDYAADAFTLTEVFGIKNNIEKVKTNFVTKMKNKVLKRTNTFLNIRSKQDDSWKNIEYFDESWKDRIRIMAEFIESGSSVMDLGCGMMWLKEFLKEGSIYIGVDYTNRGGNNLVCDFNKHEFPSITVDYVFVSGCLEYIEDVDWFITSIKNSCSKVVLSYCTFDYFNDLKLRRSYTWVNHYSKSEIISKFRNAGFYLNDETITSTKNSIFYFSTKNF